MARITDQLQNVLDTRQPARVDVTIEASPGEGPAVRDLLTQNGLQFTSVDVRNKSVFETTVTPQIINRLAESDAIATIDHSPIFRPLGTAIPIPGEATIAPNVNRVTLKQVMNRLDVPQAWEDAGTKGENVRIGMVDSPVDERHPALRDSVVDTERNSSSSLHGTWVASAAVADEWDHANGTIMGAAPDAELVAHGALSGGGASVTEVAEGIDYCIRMDCDIVNLSLGGEHSTVLQSVVQELTDSGIVPVSSVGNSGPGPQTASCPSHHADSLAVGSVNGEGDVAGFSARGPGWGLSAVKPDLCAYGGHSIFTSGEQVVTEVILGAAPQGGAEYLLGTSMASPQVAGITALKVAQERQ